MQAPPDLAVINAAQLVTLEGPARPRVGPEMRELGLIENGGLLIQSGLISAVGNSDEISRMVTKETQVVDARGCVVLPGFVDAHTHAVFAGNRVEEYELRSQGASYEEIAAAGGGIKRTVQLTREATEEQLFQQAEKHACWFLANGTTHIEVKSGYGLSPETEMKMLRVVKRFHPGLAAPGMSSTFLGAHAFPEEFENDHEGYVRLVIETMLPAVKESMLASCCDVFCERNYFSIDDSRRILLAAKALGFGLRIHADQLTCNGGAQLAAEVGALTADHLEQTDKAGIQALASAGVQPVLLPASVYALGHERYPKAREMIEAGLAVVLATDFNPGSSPTPSMPMVLSLACTHMGMTPPEAITAATVNAAWSLRLGSSMATLKPGKQANFTIFDCKDYREIPYYFGAPLVKEVFRFGKMMNRQPFESPTACHPRQDG